MFVSAQQIMTDTAPVSKCERKRNKTYKDSRNMKKFSNGRNLEKQRNHIPMNEKHRTTKNRRITKLR